MIVLPIIYIALIALACMGVYWYAIHATVMFEAMGRGGRGSGRAGLLILVAYAGPLIAGAILVFFMIKPLFARRTVTSHPLSLNRGEQPLLFGFIERLCESSAPRSPAGSTSTRTSTPPRVFVKVVGVHQERSRADHRPAAGCRDGSAHADRRAGARVRALRAGHGNAADVLIRSSTVVARVVYERDSWTNGSSTRKIVGALVDQPVIGLSRLFVWMTRRILWVLMVIGTA
jgi:hypothetical protein